MVLDFILIFVKTCPQKRHHTMSTLTLIHQEAESLSGDLQKKVLAFIELLKFKNTVKQVEQLAQELSGIEELSDEDVRALLTETDDTRGGDLSLNNLQEKIAVAERVSQALGRMREGEPGLTQKEMKEQVRQWQNK